MINHDLPAKKKVLIIEDDVEMLDMYALKFRHMGFDAIACEQAQKGLDVYKRDLPDAVVLDILMPNVNGLTILRKMRMINGKIPIIVCSNLKNVFEEQCFDFGATDYIVKASVTPKELVEKVIYYLEGEKKL